jgi:hypothetical protein
MDAEKNTHNFLDEWLLNTRSPLDLLVYGNIDTVFRFLVYRRMFTPYEEEHKFIDDTEFADTHYAFAKIVDMVPLGRDDWLLEMRILDEEGRDCGRIEYWRLSEIRLCRFDIDNEEQCNEEDDFYES